MSLQNARALRKNMTDCERLLWNHLRGHRLVGYKFKRQQPIGSYIVDFVCFASSIIVEADGGQHAEQGEYDDRRDAWLNSQGFTVLRFWNNDILTNNEGVLATIAAACRDNTPSPQPLSHQGRGARKHPGSSESLGITGERHHAKAKNPNAASNSTSPLPSRERGRGRGGNDS